MQYSKRPCPHCQQSDAAAIVAQSFPRAEHQSFGELLRQWDTDIFTNKTFFTYSRCRSCGMVYCPEYPNDSQLARLYGSMKPNMAELPEECFRRTQNGYLATAMRYRPPAGDVIELGPDRGFLASATALRGHFSRFWFVEPNEAVHETVRKSVAPIPCDISTALNSFSHIPDAVGALAFMVHVLDHLTDPLHQLKQLFRCLKPGGLISIVVHNEQSLLAKLFGSRHPIYCPYHPQLFNPKTLAAMLATAGFDVLDINRTRNHYPLGYLARNAVFRAGLGGAWVPELRWAIVPLPLGNIQAIARKQFSE